MLLVSSVVPSSSLATQPAEATTTSCAQGPKPSMATTGTYVHYPKSITYQAYTTISPGVPNFTTPDIPPGPAAVSVGVYGGVLRVQVMQSGTQILSTIIIGGRFYDDENYVVVHGATSYCYVNFDSDGQPLDISVSAMAGQPLVAYNVYNNYISSNTAALIMYPRQFYADILPDSTPVNTGVSFLIVAPNYSEPTPLAIWIGEGSGDPATGQEWWAQVGFVSWIGDFNASYAFMEMFSNIESVEQCNTCNTSGPIISNYRLIPGDTYNFTMAVASGTTWEFSVNGTAIQGGNFKGLYDTTSYSNNGMGLAVAGGESLGLETLASWGGNVGISNPITIPVMSSFRVNGTWSEPRSFAFSNVGEEWGSGQASSSPGIDLWGIAGHSQEGSIPCGTLMFSDSLPPIMQDPESNSEPLYACSGTATIIISGAPSETVSGPIVLTATVSPAAMSSVAPTGEVAWNVNGNDVGSCILSETGSCTISYAPSTPGRYVVSALYLGDSKYAGSTGTRMLTIGS